MMTYGTLILPCVGEGVSSQSWVLLASSPQSSAFFNTLLDGLPCGWALSTWDRNHYRKTDYLDLVPPDATLRSMEHFYHVGASESNRTPMVKALAIRGGPATTTASQSPEAALRGVLTK